MFDLLADANSFFNLIHLMAQSSKYKGGYTLYTLTLLAF